MDSAVGSTSAVCCVLARCVLGCNLNRAALAPRDWLDLGLQSARVVSLIPFSRVQRRFSTDETRRYHNYALFVRPTAGQPVI
jgi:hypothetical protein